MHAALRHLLRVLRADARIPARLLGRSHAIHEELERFTSHLERVAGLAAKTSADRRWWVEQFLAGRFGCGPIAIHRLTVRDIADYLEGHGTRRQRYAPGTVGIRSSALRSYLRFRAARCGDRVDALIAAIPRVASWRLDSLPSHLTPDETVRFLGAFDRHDTNGQRGYAMARCMLDLGLRASEVTNLKFDDLNWQDGTVRIGAGKSRRVDILPLTVLTGQAIAEYLQHGRPPNSSRAVFVRDRAPVDAPLTTEIVSHAMETAFARSGLGGHCTGTHILRRTTATQLRRSGASLKQIADVLRHRSLDTTTIYTKIDHPQLATVAAPWPGARP
jgi:integrase